MHVVDARGRVKSGGDAMIALMALNPKTRRKAWLAMALPPLRRKARVQYEQLAARRSELSAKVPDAEVTVVEPGWVRLPSG